MKKIILVNASPRAKGNCVDALNILAENVKDAEVVLFDLNKKVVNPCKACNACKMKENVFCVQKDDMSALLPELDACDALVVASPIYFGMVTAPAKAFLDRCYPFFNPTKPNMTIATKFGKKVAVITTAGSGPVDVYKKHGEDYCKFGVAGFTQSKVLSFNSAKCGPMGKIFADEAYAQEIKNLAAWLSE